MTVINVTKQFTRYPAGRYLTDGPFSGQKFRDEILIPAFEDSADQIKIELDGTRGYGSSFLEEAFGGLVRNDIIKTLDDINRIHLISASESLIQEIQSYMVNAIHHKYNHVKKC